jgi:general secretion pathway protein D
MHWSQYRILTISALLGASTVLSGMSFSEKREQLTQQEKGGDETELRAIQDALQQKKEELNAHYVHLHELLLPQNAVNQTPSEEQLIKAAEFRKNIIDVQKQINALEKEWKDIAGSEANDDFEGLWHQPDTTIGQLVIDYNPGDVVYIMPPDIAALKIHVSSRLSVPRAAWKEMLEVILSSCGVGIKPLTPFLKQLYVLRVNQSGLYSITDDRLVLNDLPPDEKIAFVCSPPTGDLRRVYQFLEKFAPQEQVIVQLVGGHLLIVGLVREVKDLMKVYDFVASPKCSQEYRIVSLQRADSEEMAKILTSIFEGDISKASESPLNDKSNVFVPTEASFGFRVIALKYPASSLFFLGKHEQIERACQIIKEVEVSIGEVQEKTIQLYPCKHSEAEELAKVLSQVYVKLMGLSGQNVPRGKKSVGKPSELQLMKTKIEARERAQDALIVDSTPVSLATKKTNEGDIASENFIVDQKTNSIIMVVEAYIWPKLKELLHKLDIPKRMVQIDVLLFEKKIGDSSSIGLSNLKMADAASKKTREGLTWQATEGSKKKGKKKSSGGDSTGILEFFLSRKRNGWLPAYDLAYQFLLSQEDIQINANPSITTVNQTQAKIAVVDQISINTGAVEFDRDHFKDSYSRAEYGITIQITPTIHAKIDEEGTSEPKYITLATDIIFDSARSDKNDRPNVTRRNVKNEVCIRDGETAILGGLRRKESTGTQHIIPFLGELPGIGKLFASSQLSDLNTEMFIFLTPKILSDDRDEWKEARLKELVKRPGDLPEFMKEVQEARGAQEHMLMEKSLRMLIGKPDNSF